MKKIKRILPTAILLGLTLLALVMTSCSSTNPPENQTLYEELGKLGIGCDDDDKGDSCNK